jgi:hypothetical protein
MFILATALLVTTANGTIIRVPEDQATIQAGIDVANAGDTVLVAVGILSGDGNRDIEFRGKNVVVKSVAGPNFTIIDCQGLPDVSHSAFWLHEAEDTSSVIEGFSITGAWARGAIMCSTSVATVKNCIIELSRGNGIYCYQPWGDPWMHIPMRVYECDISGSTGNGIWINNRPADIRDCRVHDNDTSGIYYYATGENSTFSRLLLANNKNIGILIGENLAGGAVVENVTTVNNRVGLYVFSDFPKTAGVTLRPQTDSTIIRNCIAAFNSFWGFVTWSLPPITIGSCNDAYGNDSANFFNVSFSAGDTLGNFSFDPLFCGRSEGDFHVSSQSPCAPDNNSCHTLIGVYDVACTCCIGLVGNVDGDSLDQVDLSDLTALVDHLFDQYPVTPCFDEVDIDGSGSVDISDLSALIDYIFRGVPIRSCV